LSRFSTTGGTPMRVAFQVDVVLHD